MNDRGGFDSRRRSFVPVKVGDELDVTIEAVGEKGDGIAKREGFVLFVPTTNQGDNVKIKVTRVLRRVGFAEVIGSSTGSPAKAAPADEGDEDIPADEEQTDEGSDDEDFSEDSEDSEDFGDDDRQ